MIHKMELPATMDDEPYTEPPPPSAEKVARRALILSVIACRGIVEGDKQNPEGAAKLANQSYQWLLTLGLESDFSDWERRIFNTPFGQLTVQDRVNASWLSEAVVVMAWALGKTNLPGFSEQCDPAGSANSLGFLQSVEATALNGPQLLPADVLQEYNEFVYNVHWRIRDFSFNKKAYNFESLANNAWGEPLIRHGLTLAEDKDISLNGITLSKMPESEWRPFASITRERHQASNWLIGYASEDFYEVTTDT
jgi:hypothetical protein